MKFSLTINSDDPHEIKRLVDFFSGSTSAPAIAAHQQIAPTNVAPISDTSDDDTGPANDAAPLSDTQGIPWDDRIHSKNKGLNSDGTWRKKRGVTPEMITAVENELRTRGSQQMYMQQPQPMPQMQQQPVMQMQQPQPMPQMQMPVMQQPNMMQQPMPQMQQQQPTMQMQQPTMQMPVMQQQPLTSMDFGTFMQHLTVKMAERNPNTGAPLIDVEYLKSIVARLNTAFQMQWNVITDCATNPQALLYAAQLMQNEGRW